MAVEESGNVQTAGGDRANVISRLRDNGCQSTENDRPRFEITGIEVDNLNQDEAVECVTNWLRSGSSHYAVVVNASKMAAARRDHKLKAAILEADLVTADGMSVVWASKLLGRPLKERVTGIDLFERLVGVAADYGASVFFLGATSESVLGIVDRFKVEYPNLRIAGYRDGYFRASEQGDVAAQIKNSGAEVLFVALGSPKQEVWISTFIRATGVRFALGVGGAFDHLSGRVRRAPNWMQKTGFEWLYRLSHEPKRLWRRYLIGNTRFVWLVIKQRLGKNKSRRRDYA
jgi:N-acetylglucosaminyldiphosphoundecaprenol N-acetyl-beta-D-mannosaminyltransferase